MVYNFKGPILFKIDYTCVMQFTWFTAEELKGWARGATSECPHCEVSQNKTDLTWNLSNSK